MDAGTPGCLSPPPAPGLCRAPRLALLAPVCARCCRAPASILSNAILAALQLRGQGAGKREEEKKFLHWQGVAVSLSFVHGKTSALPTVKKL